VRARRLRLALGEGGAIAFVELRFEDDAVSSRSAEAALAGVGWRRHW
jgi:hypothetical protein